MIFSQNVVHDIPLAFKINYTAFNSALLIGRTVELEK